MWAFLLISGLQTTVRGDSWSRLRLSSRAACSQAEDDPIAVEPAIPYTALADNPNCILVTTPGGGHLGWAAGSGGPFGESREGDKRCLHSSVSSPSSDPHA